VELSRTGGVPTHGRAGPRRSIAQRGQPSEVYCVRRRVIGVTAGIERWHRAAGLTCCVCQGRALGSHQLPQDSSTLSLSPSPSLSLSLSESNPAHRKADGARNAAVGSGGLAHARTSSGG
jgi:hypothetical protein